MPAPKDPSAAEYYVYHFVCRGVPFYVGVGRSGRAAMRVAWVRRQMAKKRRGVSAKWVLHTRVMASLLRAGEQIEVQYVADGLVRAEALHRERQEMDRLLAAGIRLANLQNNPDKPISHLQFMGWLRKGWRQAEARTVANGELRRSISRDIALALQSGLSEAARRAVLHDALWRWSQLDGKREGCRYWSSAALISRRKTNLIHEHVVPRAVLVSHFESRRPEEEEVHAHLTRMCVAAVITEAENRKLGGALHRAMPRDWNGDDIWARYRAAGIQVVDTKTGKVVVGPETRLAAPGLATAGRSSDMPAST